MPVASIVDILKQMLARQLVAASHQTDEPLVIDRYFMVGATFATNTRTIRPRQTKRTWRLRKVVSP